MARVIAEVIARVIAVLWAWVPCTLLNMISGVANGMARSDPDLTVGGWCRWTYQEYTYYTDQGSAEYFQSTGKVVFATQLMWATHNALLIAQSSFHSLAGQYL